MATTAGQSSLQQGAPFFLGQSGAHLPTHG